MWTVFGDTTFARIDPQPAISNGRMPPAAFGGRRRRRVVWVVSVGNSTVYRYAPATFLEGPIGRAGVGGRSTAIAYGHGAVWVTSESDDLVARIDPGNYASQIPVGDSPWPSRSARAPCGSRTRVTAPSRASTPRPSDVTTIDVGQAPVGIAVGNGLVWVTVQAP